MMSTVIKGNITVRTCIYREERSLVTSCHYNFKDFKSEERKATNRLSGRNDEFPRIIEHFDSIHDFYCFRLQVCHAHP